MEQHPWEMVWGQPYIDSDRLLCAIEWELEHNQQPDFRTRLLIKDAAQALQSFRGPERFEQWLKQSAVKEKIKAIMAEDLGEPGFRNIRKRLVTNIRKDQLEQVFELLGKKIHKPIEVYIAGSIPALIDGLSARPTDDIDFVDEVPIEIREQKEAVQQITDKYGLTLGHVQSQYLPKNWHSRRRYMGKFGGLTVYLVDEYDIFVSKLSSTKEKHQDDLRVLSQTLDKAQVRKRLLQDGMHFLERAEDKSAIEANWKFIYREPLIL